MNPSDSINSYEWLSVWNLRPIAAAVVTFGVGFAVVYLMMIVEGIPKRGLFLNFITNNGVLLPLYVAMVTVVLQHAETGDAFYTKPLWHLACLVLPVSVWVMVDAPNYQLAQLASPAKIAHTLAVIPIGYWLIAPLPAVLDTFKPLLAGIIALLALVGAVWFWVGPQAGKVVYRAGATADPHVKWSWRTLRATPTYDHLPAAPRRNWD